MTKSKCNKCGACCREITFVLTPNPMIAEFHKTRGFTIRTIGRMKITETIITLPHRCPYLTENNLCKIHDSKPVLCKTLPEKLRKDLLKFQPESCAFKK